VFNCVSIKIIFSQITLLLDVVDWKYFTADFHHLKVENPMFRHFSCFDHPNDWNGEVWEANANFGVVGKPILTFSIAVH